MRTLILAAGHLNDELRARIEAGDEPRLDVFDLQAELKADLLDFTDVDRSKRITVRAARRALGPSAALAVLGASERGRYDAILTTGEDIGIPLAALLKLGKAPSHTMIAHTLVPLKKRVFFKLPRLQDRIDCILCYATSEERHMIDRLSVPAEKARRIFFHADDAFFRPEPGREEPDLVCSAGQLLRDYDSLIEAVSTLPVRLSIAAGSPWISHRMKPRAALPVNVDWQRYTRKELRELYARSAVAVVPIFENDYQTGISTILEMMAAGKCVIATRTRGQTDTIIDGVTGIYVPPGDPAALRRAIERVLGDREEAGRIGRAARAFIEKEASTRIFVDRVASAVRGRPYPTLAPRA